MKPIRFLAAACLLALAACQHTAPRNPMATWVPSPNHDARRAQLIVLHYTEQDSVQRSLDTLRSANSGGRVSSHYLLGDDGAIYQLVSDDHRAWHAGVGRWGTIHELNSASIGIEIDNDGREPFSDAQIASLVRLLEDLTRRHRIPKTEVIGHSDLAPGRKIDPGPRFPWQRLHEAGFGLWPDPDAAPPPPEFDPVEALRLIGYSVDDLPATIHSYRMRFRGDNARALDAEDLRILHSLASQVRAGR
ncbi:MAG: N-acetylmuramoyl-L-alanine amidase [Xanthomonadales bacterium]|nr:N-acetylmuramoyl-L-alanine amidase [Xanthomonadales bacterium]